MTVFIKPKRTTTSSKVPTTSELADGELAVNTTDGKSYVRNGLSVFLVGEKNEVPASRSIATTAPLTGGGDLSANRTLGIDAATTLAAGSMSAADKTKLDGIAAGATAYTDANARTAVIASSVSDGDTTHSPSGDAVFDALALKTSAAANETIVGTWRFQGATFIYASDQPTIQLRTADDSRRVRLRYDANTASDGQVAIQKWDGAAWNPLFSIEPDASAMYLGTIRVGQNIVPVEGANADFTYVSAYLNRARGKTTGTPRTYTVDASVLTVGASYYAANYSTAGDVTVAAAGGTTLRRAGVAASGSFTVPPLSIARLWVRSSTEVWWEMQAAETGWATLPLASGWSVAGGVGAVAEYKKVGNIVYLRGMITGMSTAGTAMFTLPAGFRPSTDVTYSGAGTVQRWAIQTTGVAVPSTGTAAGVIPLDALFFFVD